MTWLAYTRQSHLSSSQMDCLIPRRNALERGQEQRERLRRLQEELEQRRQQLEDKQVLREALALSRQEYAEDSQLKQGWSP